MLRPLLTILLCLAAPSLHAATYNLTILPRQQDACGKALYRLWIPDDAATIRGIIVRQHGCGEGARQLGLEHADDPQWQALAKKWDCALLGSQLWAPEEDCSTWTIPQDGSAHAFHSALKQFARLSARPEIEFVPWCLWGHSGGAMWVCNMTYRYPDRVVAAFPRSGGLAPTGREFSRSQPAQFDDSPKAFDVPILFCFGEREDVAETRFFAGVDAARKLFEHGRRHNALWSLAVHPGSEHENGNSRLLAIRFFDACLAQRLPPATPGATKPIAPLPVSRERSWLADVSRHKLARESEFAGDASGLAWLPDTPTAVAWKEFCERGAIADKTPPPAPAIVRTKSTEAGVTIEWEADADIESGIAAFRVFRDGVQIAEIRGVEDRRWNPHAHYHAWNYSDQPLHGTEFPAKTHLDNSPSARPDARYTVTTINQSGLESEPAGVGKVAR